MANQSIKRACRLVLCLSVLLLSAFPTTLLSDQKAELHQLEQTLSVCYTTEEQNAVVRAFLNRYPFLKEEETSKGIKVDSIATVQSVECGTLDAITLMEVISRLDEETREEISKAFTEPPNLDKEIVSDHFVVHYTTTIEPHITEDKFAQWVSEGMEISWNMFHKWGYDLQPASKSNPYHVYVGCCNSVCEPYKGSKKTWIGINKLDYQLGIIKDKTQVLERCAHEYYHATQFAYIWPFEDKTGDFHPDSKQWAIEGSAMWMEHEVLREKYKVGDSDTVKGLIPFLEVIKGYLRKPHRDIESTKGTEAYETAAYWFFIADNSRIDFSSEGKANQRNVIRKFWEKMHEDYDDKKKGMSAWNEVYSNLDELLHRAGDEYNSFDKSFKAFVQSNYFKDFTSPGLEPWYDPSGTFTQDMWAVKQSVPYKFVQLSSTSLPETLDSTKDANIKALGNYSSWYFLIYNDTKSNKQLKVSFSGDSSMFWIAFEDGENENTKTRIVGNTTSICVRKGRYAVVIVGRLGGGTKKDYTLKIEDETCKPKTKENTYKSKTKEETCNRLDLIFVIDVTGSMADDIGAVKNSATTIVNTITSMICDFRVGIVAYRDHPVYPYGNPGDAMFEDYAFSTDRDTIIKNINSLKVFGGADWEESVYDALLRAIDSSSIGGWREGVNKVLILMGDAPPHNPCPFHGYTSKHVIDAAYNVDPAIIYSICIGSDPYAFAAFKEISEGTGGEVFTALTADDVVDTLLEAVGTAIVGPPTPVPAPEPVPAQPDVPPPDYNEMMRPLALENIKKARDLQCEVDNLVKEITNQGKEIPEEILNLIELAETSLKKAEHYNARGNFIAANYWAIKAQQLFEEAIEALKNLNS